MREATRDLLEGLVIGLGVVSVGTGAVFAVVYVIDILIWRFP